MAFSCMTSFFSGSMKRRNVFALRSRGGSQRWCIMLSDVRTNVWLVRSAVISFENATSATKSRNTASSSLTGILRQPWKEKNLCVNRPCVRRQYFSCRVSPSTQHTFPLWMASSTDIPKARSVMISRSSFSLSTAPGSIVGFSPSPVMSQLRVTSVASAMRLKSASDADFVPRSTAAR